MPRIIIVNASNVLSDAEAAAVVPAIQRWDSEMLAPAWGFPPARYSFLTWADFFANQPPVDPEIWPIFLNRHSTDAGVLGWHDDEQARVFGRIFVGDCLTYGVSWTVDLSHEAGEMRGNPDLNETVTLPDGRIALRELCDPCEDDSLAIEIDGFKFSDFVLPAYFTGAWAPWDYQKKLLGPCPTLATGGYQTLLVNGVWTQVTAMHASGGPSYRSSRRHSWARRSRIMAASPLAT